MTNDSWSSSSSAETPVEPPTVPGYAIKLLIAKSNTSDIYLAVDSLLQKEVAIKVPRFPSYGTESVENFTQTARTVAQLNYPGIPPVWKLGTLADGRPFLVMALVKGESLAQSLSQRAQPRLDYMRFMPIFEKLCQTMAQVHSQQVVHGRLKPGNILVSPFGEAQVLGWSMSRHEANEHAASADKPGNMPPLETLNYTPPEFTRSDSGSITCRADVFALGRILEEILTGSPAFQGSSSVELIKKLASGDLSETFARLENCGADGVLVALARRCLNPDPGQRPANAGELASALASFRIGHEERLRREAAQEMAATLIQVERGKKRQLLLALTLVVGLFVLWSLVFFWWYDRQLSKWRLLYGSPPDERRTLGPGKQDRPPAVRSKDNQDKLKQLKRAQQEHDAATRIMNQNRAADPPPAPVPVAPPPREIKPSGP